MRSNYEEQIVILFKQAEQGRFRASFDLPPERYRKLFEKTWGAHNNFLNLKYPNERTLRQQLNKFIENFQGLYEELINKESKPKERHIIDNKGVLSFSSIFEQRLNQLKKITTTLNHPVPDKRPPGQNRGRTYRLTNIKDLNELVDLLYAIRNTYCDPHGNTVTLNGLDYTLVKEGYFIYVELMRAVIRHEGLKTERIIP